MTEHPENGFPLNSPSQTSSPATESCGVDPPSKEGELQNEGSQNLPALAPQHSSLDERRTSAERVEPFTTPTGEVSIIFNLDDIEAYAAEYPAAAAMQCGKALAKFTEGERRAKRRALSTVFLITYNIYHSKDQVDFFNMQYCTYSSTNRKESVEKTHDKLMYRVCEFIYYCFGNATKNNAYIYGHALDYYLKNNEDLSYVKKLIMEHGPEKLYRAALKRNALEEVKTSYEQSGRKIDEPIDQDYLLQVASETNWGERAESLGPPLNDQAQKEQTNETMELTMNRDVASRDDYLDPEYILSNDDDDQETNDDAEDDEDELWNALMRIERKVSRLTSIVLRLETGLNKLTDTLQAR